MRKIYLAGLAVLLVACQNTQKTTSVDQPTQNDTVQVGTAAAATEKADTAKADTTADTLSALVTPNLGKTLAKKEQVQKGQSASEQTNSFTVSKRFSGSDNDTLTLGSAQLCVPAEGMKAGMKLSITPLDSAALPSVPAGLANVTTNGGGYRFLPHGEHFKRFAKVVIPFDSLRIPKGYTAKDIRTYYYDEQVRKWTVLPKDSILKDQQLASALTTHFTDMINGIITVPETPEAQGYAPTTLSDIKAADPSAGKMAVEAPKPNNNGTANIQIPFNFPKGRAGMGPNFSVGYSNEGGSSWCGYGWGVNTPSISIETRWGVPRYDTKMETESYLLNGEQFTDRAYRDVTMKRTKDKRFYPRRESDFAEIVRKGDAPTNYTWEVKHLDGTTDYYEGIEKDDKGNIAKWGLKKTTDAHGNCVTYDYGTSNGTAYISSINYTGFSNEEGAYTIRVNRKGDREDPTSNGRNGFLQKDDQLLTSIEVLFKEEVIRSYKFEYTKGQFGKTLLAAVAETDAEGTELYRNGFKYHDALATGGIFGESETYKVDRSIIRQIFETAVSGFEGSTSLINGSSSSGFSTQGGLDIGVGLTEVTPYAGGSYSYDKSESNGETALTDMDGDGLADLVYYEPITRKVYYKKNLLATAGKLDFGESKLVKGLSCFSNSVNEGHSIGTETGLTIGEGGKAPKLTTSYTNSKEDSRIRVYFNDFNGDGIIDVANKGTVKFGHLEEDGSLVYENHSLNTPNPIVGTGTAAMDFVEEDTVKMRDSLEKEFPLLDVVRVWRAPFDGDITIASTVKVCDSSLDGVKFALQIADTVKHKGTLMANASAEVGGKYTVKSGDLVMFRLQSNYSGTNDDVEWAPIITYDSIYNNLNLTNENNIDLTYYDATKDYLPLEQPIVVVGGPSTVKVTSNLKKEKLSEDAVLKFYRDSVLVYTDTLKAEEVKEAEGEEIFTERIVGKDTINYTFEIETLSQIDHRQIVWTPIVERDREIGENTVHETNHVSPKRTYYNKIIHLENPVVLTIDTSSAVHYKNDSMAITVHCKPEADSLSLTIKNKDGGLVSVDSLKLVSAMNGKEVFVSLNSLYELENVDSAYIAVHRTRIDSIYNEKDSTWEYRDVDTVVTKVNASVYSRFDNNLLGMLFNGWGQFAINGNEPDARIDVTKLKDSYNQLKSVVVVADTVSGVSNEKENEKYFHTMLYNAESDKYMSSAAYISATGGCPTRMGVEEIELDVPDYSGDENTVKAPYIKQHSVTNSVNTSGNVGGVGANVGTSKTTTYSEFSVMDLNGDRYPDWVSGGDDHFSSRYTKANGEISDEAEGDVSTGQNQQVSEGISAGISYSGSGGSDTNAPAETGKGETKKNAFRVCQESKQAGCSYGASGNFSSSSSYSEKEWFDVNGDGLQDLVYKGGNVRYNIGYGFTKEYTVNNLGNLSKNSSKQGGAGLNLGVDFGGHANISFGANYTNTNNYTNLQMTDLNGDGLQDRVYYDSDNDELKVDFFTGTDYQEGLRLSGSRSGRSKSVGEGFHENVAVPITIYYLMVKFKVTPYFNHSTNSSVSKTIATLQDMNGDGLPDRVVSKDDYEMEVTYNRTGRTNMLDSIVMPGGAKIALKYEQTKNSYEMPNRKYVLSGVEVLGGNPENGATRTSDTIIYEGGLYDRYEREFLGFSKVITKQLNTEKNDAVYRSSELTYSNKRLIEKGLLLADTTLGADGELLAVTNNVYNPVLTNGSEFLALIKTIKESYTDGNAIVVSEDYTYDEIGNVTRYTSTAGDVVNVTVQYNTGSDYLKRIPTKVHVEGGATRDRSCLVNDKGDITKITMENGSTPSVFDFEYDQYGNITKVTRPENEQGQRMWNKYTYDDVMHAMVTEISNAYGYKASTEYDYRFGVPTKTTDINNNDIKYEFDSFGRMTKVVGPYDEDYTIKMVYEKDGINATTYNHTLEGDIETITTADNLMRPVRIKKTSVVDGRKGYVVSGVTVLDAFGRVVKEALPALEGQTSTYYTTTEYDNQDRKVKVTLPDGSESKMAYEVENNGLKVTATDAEGHISEQYTDARERTVKTVRKGSPEDVVVEYQFNGLGGLETVTHPNGLKTKYTYDKLGHKLTVDNPDAGKTTYTYDAVGNVVTKTTPNLAKIGKGGYIKYVYDYERLSEVQYPKNVVNRVQYTYGKAGDDYNRAGRVVLVEDASGGVEHFYGKLGEEVKTIRTVLLNSADIRTYVAESEFDSWNRIRKMTYPDGEVVTYGYDEAGQLNKMSSEKDGFTYDFIKAMTYDVYGNISSKTYGNGTTTNYTYDPKRQHLTQMTAANKDGEFINATYSYDKIDNILGITNTAKPNSTIGGNSHHSYTYDDFSRLVSAEGGCKDNTVTYSLTMTYDVMSNPLRKNQTISGSTVATSHDLTYLYEGEKPDAASQIGEDRYTYDDNGNPTLIVSDSTTRTITWDEENRMVMLNDDGYVSRYTYDFSGTRVIKSHGPQESVYINGAEQGLDYHDADNYTLYVSPYLIVSNERFTKHYYAGTQRIASKVGSGDFYNVYGVNGFHLTAGDKDYKERLEQIEEGVKEYYNANGIPPGEPTMKGSNADPYVADVALPNAELGDYSVPTNWPTNVKFNEPGDVPGPVVQFEDDDQGDVKAGYGFESDNLYEGDWFFFHTDHLGSTSYLTDTAGNVSQFVCYTPYGEAIVDEHLTTYENPFKFSGKELDDITGLYDHGARSRNPVSTLWYGIDPLFEKYPDFSPYNYCAGNPVKLVDPDGRVLVFAEGSSEAFKKNFSMAYNYLKEHNASFVIDKLNNRDEIIILKETDGGSRYRPSEKTIFWNPYSGLETTNDKRLSPASVLSHESDHANHDCDDPVQHRLDSQNGTDEQYGKREERRVISGSEQIVALRLGEINEGEITRDDHNGYPIETESPISTKGEAMIEEIDAVIVTLNSE